MSTSEKQGFFLFVLLAFCSSTTTTMLWLPQTGRARFIFRCALKRRARAAASH